MCKLWNLDTCRARYWNGRWAIRLLLSRMQRRIVKRQGPKNRRVMIRQRKFLSNAAVSLIRVAL